MHVLTRCCRGKTNVPEFAASGVTANYANGRTINPYDHTLIPGGSSGGSGAAVAACTGDAFPRLNAVSR